MKSDSLIAPAFDSDLISQGAPLLSIIVINYRTADLTAACIESVLRYTPEVPYEIILLNNGSDDLNRDQFLKRFPDITFIETGANLGFAKATNLGIQNSSGDYVLMLNSDTEVGENNLQSLIEYMTYRPEVGALGPRQTDGEGKFTPSCGDFPNLWTEIIRKLIHQRLSLDDYRLRDLIDERLMNRIQTDWVSGSCLLVRRQVLRECGLLDENFFMYYEDVDFCRRIRDKGWEVHYFAGETVVHLGGRSACQNIMDINVTHRRSQLYFTRKYYGIIGLVMLRFFLFFKYGLSLIGLFIFRLFLGSDKKEREISRTKMLLSKKMIWLSSETVASKPVAPGLFVTGNNF